MYRSIRKETSSLAFGIVGRFGGSSAGFVVAALNAASAASREVVVLRVLSAGILCPRVGLHPVKRQTGPPKRGSPALTINRVVCPSRTRAFGLLGGRGHPAPTEPNKDEIGLRKILVGSGQGALAPTSCETERVQSRSPAGAGLLAPRYFAGMISLTGIPAALPAGFVAPPCALPPR
jgi:hypothetical protein